MAIFVCRDVYSCIVVMGHDIGYEIHADLEFVAVMFVACVSNDGGAGYCVDRRKSHRKELEKYFIQLDNGDRWRKDNDLCCGGR